MLVAKPISALSSDYDIFFENRNIAFLDMKTMREDATISIDGNEVKLYREGLMSGAFILEIPEGALAIAEKPSAFKNEFVIEFLDKQYKLVQTSWFSKSFSLIQENQPVGNIYCERWYKRTVIIELPDDMPLLVQVFIFWLVLIIWKRQQNASS